MPTVLDFARRIYLASGLPLRATSAAGLADYARRLADAWCGATCTLPHPRFAVARRGCALAVACHRPVAACGCMCVDLVLLVTILSARLNTPSGLSHWPGAGAGRAGHGHRAARGGRLPAHPTPRELQYWQRADAARRLPEPDQRARRQPGRRAHTARAARAVRRARRRRQQRSGGRRRALRPASRRRADPTHGGCRWPTTVTGGEALRPARAASRSPHTPANCCTSSLPPRRGHRHRAAARRARCHGAGVGQRPPDRRRRDQRWRTAHLALGVLLRGTAHRPARSAISSSRLECVRHQKLTTGKSGDFLFLRSA